MKRTAIGAWVLLIVSAVALRAQTPPPAPAVIPAGADGAKIYAVTCVACHLATGLGMEGKVPPLAGSEWVNGEPTRMLRIILHGLTGEVEVQGETFSGAMPTWGSAFSDEQIASVASYVRSSWGNKGAPVSADQVAKVRAAAGSRKTPWTARELLQPAH